MQGEGLANSGRFLREICVCRASTTVGPNSRSKFGATGKQNHQRNSEFVTKSGLEAGMASVVDVPGTEGKQKDLNVTPEIRKFLENIGSEPT